MWGQNCQEPRFSGTGDLWFGNELASQALPPPLSPRPKDRSSTAAWSIAPNQRVGWQAGGPGRRATTSHQRMCPGSAGPHRWGRGGVGAQADSLGTVGARLATSPSDTPTRSPWHSLSSTAASSLHTTAAPLWCLSSLGGSSGLGLLTSTASSALRTGGYCVKSNAARANNLER